MLLQASYTPDIIKENISTFCSDFVYHCVTRDVCKGKKDAGEAAEGLSRPVGDGRSSQLVDCQARLLQQRTRNLNQQQTGENPGHSGPWGRG